MRVPPRGLVANRGTLVVDSRRPAIDCNVLNISAGGACVDVHGHTAIPARVTFIHSGSKKVCRVIWRKGRRIGLLF